MKKIITILIICILFFGCEKEECEIIVGTWKVSHTDSIPDLLFSGWCYSNIKIIANEDGQAEFHWYEIATGNPQDPTTDTCVHSPYYGTWNATNNENEYDLNAICTVIHNIKSADTIHFIMTVNENTLSTIPDNSDVGFWYFTKQ